MNELFSFSANSISSGNMFFYQVQYSATESISSKGWSVAAVQTAMGNASGLTNYVLLPDLYVILNRNYPISLGNSTKRETISYKALFSLLTSDIVRKPAALLNALLGEIGFDIKISGSAIIPFSVKKSVIHKYLITSVDYLNIAQIFNALYAGFNLYLIQSDPAIKDGSIASPVYYVTGFSSSNLQIQNVKRYFSFTYGIDYTRAASALSLHIDDNTDLAYTPMLPTQDKQENFEINSRLFAIEGEAGKSSVAIGSDRFLAYSNMFFQLPDLVHESIKDTNSISISLPQAKGSQHQNKTYKTVNQIPLASPSSGSQVKSLNEQFWKTIQDYVLLQEAFRTSNGSLSTDQNIPLFSAVSVSNAEREALQYHLLGDSVDFEPYLMNIGGVEELLIVGKSFTLIPSGRGPITVYTYRCAPLGKLKPSNKEKSKSKGGNGKNEEIVLSDPNVENNDDNRPDSGNTSPSQGSEPDCAFCFSYEPTDIEKELGEGLLQQNIDFSNGMNNIL